MIFFLLMWRNMHLHERASNIASAGLRLCFTLPMMTLFLLNLIGVISSLAATSHATKKRLKSILNLDKLVEVLLIGYAILRLTLFPSKTVPREIYVGGILHSVVFLLQCQAFTRFSWDDKAAPSMASYATAQREQAQQEFLERQQQAGYYPAAGQTYQR